jgi:hypothetical protein
MSDNDDSTVEQSAPEQVSDVLSQVFGPEQVDNGAEQPSKGQAASDTPVQPADQAGDAVSPEPQADEVESEGGDDEQSDDSDDGLVDVEVRKGVKERMTPAAAKAFADLNKAYKELNREFTKRNQAAKQQQNRDSQAEDNSHGDLSSMLRENDEKLYSIIADNEGEGITQELGKIVHGMVRAQVIPLVKQEIERFQSLMNEAGLMEQIGLKRTEGFLADVAKDYGLNVADTKAVQKEAYRLAESRGVESPTEAEYLRAVLAVQARDGKDQPKRNRPSAPGGIGLTGSRSAAGLTRDMPVIHRDSYY